MNKVWIVGRLTTEPIIKETSTSKTAKIIVAATQDGKTNHIKCVAFGTIATKIQERVYKDLKVAVSGTLFTSVYFDKGQRIFATEVVIDSLDIIHDVETSVTPDKLDPGDHQ